MLRLGAPWSECREMYLDDLFIGRLKLMIIMARAYLDGLPMGDIRRHAMHENAKYVASECVEFEGRAGKQGGSQGETPGPADFALIIYLKAELVAIMLRGISSGFPLCKPQIAAMHEHVDYLCRELNIRPSWDDENYEAAR